MNTRSTLRWAHVSDGEFTPLPQFGIISTPSISSSSRTIYSSIFQDEPHLARFGYLTGCIAQTAPSSSGGYASGQRNGRPIFCIRYRKYLGNEFGRRNRRRTVTRELPREDVDLLDGVYEAAEGIDAGDAERVIYLLDSARGSNHGQRRRGRFIAREIVSLDQALH